MYGFPLIERELIVTSRSALMPRLRLAFGAGTMAVVICAFLIWGTSFDVIGIILFRVLTFVAAVAALVTGIFGASDCISRERREGTLGLLFLTDLRSADVLLGKFAAAALIPASISIAMIPSFAICQLLGGVTGGEFSRIAAALLVTLFFSLSTSIFVSSICDDHRKCYGGAALLLLVLNPLWLCLAALENTYTARPSEYWLRLFLFCGLGGLFLISANRALAGSWRDIERYVQDPKNPVQRKKRWPELLDQAPIAWLMLHRHRFKGPGLWLGAAALLLIYISLAPQFGAAANRPRNLLILFLVHLGYQVVVLTRTAYSFYSDRRDGSLELLLGTRLSTAELISGFKRYLYAQSGVTLLFFTVLDLFYAASLAAAGATALVPFPLGMAATLWAAFFGIASLGIYRSLMMNHPSLSMLATFVRLSSFPLVLTALFLWVPQTDFVKVVAFWIIASLFLAAFFGSDARRSLEQHGRTLLLRPHDEKPPHIENEWSFINWDEIVTEAPPLPPK
jgi:hypothetical protein